MQGCRGAICLDTAYQAQFSKVAYHKCQACFRAVCSIPLREVCLRYQLHCDRCFTGSSACDMPEALHGLERTWHCLSAL